MPLPIYSHGGSSSDGWPAASMTTTGNGNPIQIINAFYEPIMHGQFFGTSCTVFIEGNGGIVDPRTGQPPSGEWFDYTNTGGSGYTLTNGGILAKCLPRGVPLWRTRISAMNLGGGAGFWSYIPCIIVENGNVVSAGRPSRSSNAYNPNA